MGEKEPKHPFAVGALRTKPKGAGDVPESSSPTPDLRFQGQSLWGCSDMQIYVRPCRQQGLESLGTD